MELRFSTWREIESCLEHSTGIVIPIGSIEQHGPIGLIGTDALCAEAIALQAARLAEGEILVGPTIAFGAAQFNLGFPGTISLRAQTLMQLITDYVGSLAAAGFRRFFFINGHGGNIAPANAAFHDLHADRFHREQASIRCRLRSWWEYPEVNRLRESFYAGWEGLHATPSEIAITQHVHPAHRHAEQLDRPAPIDDTFVRDFGGDRHFDAGHHRTRFPDGRIGADSSLATPQAGKQLLEAAAAALAEDYRVFVAED